MTHVVTRYFHYVGEENDKSCIRSLSGGDFSAYEGESLFLLYLLLVAMFTADILSNRHKKKRQINKNSCLRVASYDLCNYNTKIYK